MFYAVSRFEIVFCSGMLFQEGNRIKIAYFQPLTILEIEAVHKNKGTLENFKEIKSLRLFIPFIRIFTKAPW
jgi:hypothetical protein